MTSRMVMVLATAAFCLAFPASALCEEAPGGGESAPPDELKPAGGGSEKTPAEKKEDFQKRKDSFFKRFEGELEDMEKNQDDPEKEEVARLTDVRDEYKQNLKKAEDELGRSKEIVKKSFVGLLNSSQNRETLEQRCESIWLDYMATSRKSKMQIHEYERAMTGVDNRIRYIKHRLATRDYPTEEKGEKYYLSDNIELYEGADETMGEEGDAPKSQVSYYALLKDFVWGIMGKGRGQMKVISKKLTEPDLFTMYESWAKRAESRKAMEDGGEDGGGNGGEGGR